MTPESRQVYGDGRRRDILERDWMTRFSDPERLRAGCDLRPIHEVWADVVIALGAVSASQASMNVSSSETSRCVMAEVNSA